MKEIGERLQSERNARGISLAFIQEETKISRRYLDALEGGDFDRLPGDPYIKGFIRSYAKAIECDPDAVILRYNELKAENESALAVQDVRVSKSRTFLTKINETLQWFGL